jgi:uncharacterized membrane protein
MHRHPANIARHDEQTRGGRAADVVAAFLGSWRFIGLQTAVILVWIALNVVAAAMRWDPYPFILLNLLFSTQAAYAAPILQLAQNRQTEHDRVRAEADFATNERALEIVQDTRELVRDVRALMRVEQVPVPVSDPEGER